MCAAHRKEEKESIWSGVSEGAFFNGEAFDHNRKLLKPEYEYSARSSAQAYYILGVDIGRKGCETVVCVIKVTPQQQGPAIKSLVNIYTMSDEHFEDQAIRLKKLYYKYNARTMVIDANGVGLGLIDYMIKPQTDNATGDYLPPFGVENDEEGYYKKYKTDDTELDAMYLMKAHAVENTEAHANLQAQLNSGKLKFLIDERTAKSKLLSTRMGEAMTPEERGEYLLPFTLTSNLKDELGNLVERSDGVNIILKQNNKMIGKDKVSALEYGLYYIRRLEESSHKKKKFKITDMLFYS